ncbi:MAG: tRNA lysidine(34) synthetase TilS, partial [Clostridia bacterium]|nr:tRNA lysidine(34) synthetase TilS [Clostridia bacterium]
DKDYEKVHIDRIFSLCFKQNGKTETIKKNLVAYKEYDYIVIFKKDILTKTKELSFAFGSIDFLGKTLLISKTKMENSLYFDLDKIPKNAVIRTRKNGDFFTKFSGGTKKIKEFFIDKKIPLKDRDNIPLLAVDNEILMIFGIEISNAIKVDENTKNIGYSTITNKTIQ